jgi:hypothetical protein
MLDWRKYNALAAAPIEGYTLTSIVSTLVTSNLVALGWGPQPLPRPHINLFNFKI